MRGNLTELMEGSQDPHVLKEIVIMMTELPILKEVNIVTESSTTEGVLVDERITVSPDPASIRFADLCAYRINETTLVVERIESDGKFWRLSESKNTVTVSQYEMVSVSLNWWEILLFKLSTGFSRAKTLTKREDKLVETYSIQIG